MTKRKFANDDPFDNESSEVSSSWVNTGSQIFGELEVADSRVERIKKISIFAIQPDPGQPRRAIPATVNQALENSTDSITELLMIWWGLTQDERGGEFDLGAYLETYEQAETVAPGPIEAAFLEVIQLAASIRRDGLTNPITVASIGEHYRIETGERRWLAFHLLYAWYDGHDGRRDERALWEAIPTRVVDAVNVWRQASENNARANLNAIGKARQWAVLMMDLHGQENFLPLAECQTEQEYYAQVANLNVPYGKSEQLRNAMGITGRAALTRYRKILSLPAEIWFDADLHNLPEETLYNLSRLPHQEALAEYHNLQADPVDITESVAPAIPEAPGTKRHFARMTRAILKAAPGKHKFNAQALKSLRELRQWLDDQEDRIMKFMD